MDQREIALEQLSIYDRSLSIQRNYETYRTCVGRYAHSALNMSYMFDLERLDAYDII